jgi:hypothetical protein
VRRKDVSTHTFVQWRDDRLLRDQHVSQFRFQQENVLKILSRLDVSTGTNSEQYIDTLAAFTTVFDEIEVLNRSKRAQRESTWVARWESRVHSVRLRTRLCCEASCDTYQHGESFPDVGFFKTLQVSTGVMIFTYFVEYRYFLWIRLGAYFALHRQENW